MEFFRTWILPPLIGSIIGYFTNWLAIKMLFRPLEPLFIGSIRIPFTPGILPREREKLTQSVGATVSSELLTPEVFRARLTEETLVCKLEDSIAILIEGMLSNPADIAVRSLASWADRKDGKPTEINSELTEMGRVAAGALDSFLDSEEFKGSFGEVLELSLVELSAMSLSLVIPEEKFLRILEAGLEKCRSGTGSQGIEDLIDALASFGSEGDAALFPAEATSPIIQFLARSIYQALIPVMESFLEKMEINDRFSELAMSVVRETIAKMSPVQRLIVGVAQYEKTLEQAMPDTITRLSLRLVSVLKEESTKDRVVDSLVSYMGTRRQSENASSVAGLSPEGEREIFLVSGIKEALSEFFNGLDQNKEGFLAAAMLRYRRVSDTSIKELFPGTVETLSKEMLDGIRSATFTAQVPGWMKKLWGRGIAAFLEAYALRIEGKSISQIFGLDKDSMRKMARWIAKAVTEALSSQAERLVEALDIRTMVIDKLNDLKMADIERIILQVVQSELRWITILGGVLGALIGLVQSLLTLI
jgi:hypothetical protein